MFNSSEEDLPRLEKWRRRTVDRVLTAIMRRNWPGGVMINCVLHGYMDIDPSLRTLLWENEYHGPGYGPGKGATFRLIGRSHNEIEAAVRTVYDLLDPVYTPQGIDEWLQSANTHLNGESPIHLLQHGIIEPVLTEAERLHEVTL